MLARYAALLSFAVTALALSSGDLTVKLSAVSPTVSSIEDIILTAVVSNPTSEDIKFVKFNSVLDELPTKSFLVKKGDSDVLFSGVDIVPAITEDAAFVTIPAGGSIAMNHTVAASYDFESAGAGTFTFNAVTNLRVSEGGEITHFALDAASVDVEVNGDVAKRTVFPETASLRTSTPVCSNASRKNYLGAALSEARAVAGGAAANIRQSPNSANFKTYFNNHNRNDIWYNFDRIAGDLASSGNRGLHCVDRAGGICKNGGIAAYVLLVTSGGNIIGSEAYFCDWFFTSTRDLRSTCSGTNFPSTRTNVMLHELTHAIFASGDIVYDCPGSRGLSDANKKKNADNYTCFAMHNWKQHNC
ncbi:Deuterolysin metalloprotease family-domain-containing protein [Pterulicium gracile]|uniref:deuterolysin n=1 Tax=Pterulicium gracile TaxID=1884261 RepID=A0A5C3QG62_9AGAR|nr:Deuterolysin metalloprotease family-domain-containing protein [Pterula gracilis]